MLAGRYRIVGLLGKGGMGEVYRADDLKLGQAVALKLLPPEFRKDTKRLEYFHSEVRLARQVSHPNVCRVYDIGEVAGQHFLSMEYVDGEDLASLIRRIGRLPQDKGLDIARQLCAGLAAAHDRGVLHRDLKPANVMLDGRGRIRITDFGLARLVAEKDEGRSAVGTPAYMAPEQRTGGPVTKQSDIYALGLILYEVFTGQPAFVTDRTGGGTKPRDRSKPADLSSLAPDIDPVVERVIQRCIEPEPQSRPRSALAVAAALPGGDPLAAALAAGETPSPEMVAAAGESGRLRPRIALGWLAVLLLGLIAAAVLADRATVLGRAGLSEKPDALDKVARDIVDGLGYDSHPKGRAYGFEYDKNELWALLAKRERIGSEGKTAAERRPGLHFWYRQSPLLMIPLARYSWVVSEDDPPPDLPGMAGVQLRGNGELIEFYAIPSAGGPPGGMPEGAGWEKLFKAAGLDMARFEEQKDEKLTWMPPVFADRRLAWTSPSSDGGLEVRVEGASYGGRPIYFKVAGQPSIPEPMRAGIPPSDRQPHRMEKARVLEWTSILIILLGAAIVARRSLRRGRSDPKAAFRLGLFILSINLLVWLFEASHVPDLAGELALVLAGLIFSFFYAANFGITYLAFEPIIRRFWPGLLISWNRLMAGRFRDPSIGRDLLIGAAIGVWAYPVLEFATVLAPRWLGPAPPLWKTISSTLLGGRYLIAGGVWCLTAVGKGLMYLLMLGLFRIVLRKWWFWAPVFVIQGAFYVVADDPTSIARWILATVMWTALFLLYTRLGFLAAVAFLFVADVLADFPLTANTDAWYWNSSLFALAFVAALGIYGFATSSRGRSLVHAAAASDRPPTPIGT
jgi:serine/threonine-protein kinase